MKIWNRYTLVGTALILAAALLAGCTAPKSESNSLPAETQTPAPTQEIATAEPQPSPEMMPEATEKPADQAIENIAANLQYLSGWGQGTAGSSLQSAQAAYELIVCCDENRAEALEPEDLKAAIAEWFATVPEDLQPDIKDNWQTVASMGKSILAQEEYAILLLADLERTPIESETAEKNWNSFCQAADEVLAQ